MSILNNTEKEYFLNLLINTAEIDGNFSEEEKQQMSAYVLEMGLTLKERDKYALSIDELLEKFQESSLEVKKAIFMEITAFMLADGMAQEEMTLLNHIQIKFNFDTAFKNEVIDWYNDIMPLYQKGFALAGLVTQKGQVK